MYDAVCVQSRRFLEQPGAQQRIGPQVLKRRIINSREALIEDFSEVSEQPDSLSALLLSMCTAAACCAPLLTICLLLTMRTAAACCVLVSTAATSLRLPWISLCQFLWLIKLLIACCCRCFTRKMRLPGLVATLPQLLLEHRENGQQRVSACMDLRWLKWRLL